MDNKILKIIIGMTDHILPQYNTKIKRKETTDYYNWDKNTRNVKFD